MLAGTGGHVSTPSKLELKPLVELVAVCGGGPPDVAMPKHRVSVPAVQRQHPHKGLRARQHWQQRYVQAVYNQATGLDSLHLNRYKASGPGGQREHVVEPLDGNTRLTALLDFYANRFAIGPDSDGQSVYYTAVADGANGRPMREEEREWLDGRELPVIWYDNVESRVAAEVFVGLNRYKTPICTHEIASALIHGSNNPSLITLREACALALPGLTDRRPKAVLESAVARDLQTFVSFCACAALSLLDGAPPLETPEFVDTLSRDAFNDQQLESYRRIADALPAIVDALIEVWNTVVRLRIPLAVAEDGHLVHSRNLKRPVVLVIVYATVVLGSTSVAIAQRFSSLVSSVGYPQHAWYAAARNMKTHDCVVAAAATLDLERGEATR